MAIPAEHRFMEKFVLGPGGCWLWTANTPRKGYGLFQVSAGTSIGAHRFAYQTLVGPIPEGMHLDHLCRNPSCVNPYHLDPVPPQINGHRSDSWAGINHRKTHCPEDHPYAGDNLLINAKGARVCRTCKRRKWREWNARRRAA